MKHRHQIRQFPGRLAKGLNAATDLLFRSNLAVFLAVLLAAGSAVWIKHGQDARPRIVYVNVDRLIAEQNYALARAAADENLSDNEIQNEVAKWARGFQALLDAAAAENNVVIVPNAVGAEDWTPIIRDWLRPVRGGPVKKAPR